MVWRLWERGGPDRYRPMETVSRVGETFERQGLRVRALGMARTGPVAEGWLHRVELMEGKGFPEADVEGISLIMDLRPVEAEGLPRVSATELVRGEVEDLERGRTWAVTSGQRIVTGSAVAFRRVDGPSRVAVPVPVAVAGVQGERELDPTAPRFRWRVTLWTPDPVDLGLRGHETAPVSMRGWKAEEGAWVVTTLEGAERVRVFVPHGNLLLKGTGAEMRRKDLLGVIWGRSGGGWVLGWLVVGLGLIGIGLACTLWRGDLPVPWPAWRTGVLTAVLFLGFGLLQMLMHPPVHGPGEPEALLTRGLGKGEGRLVADLEPAGGWGLYERLVGRPELKLMAADVESGAVDPAPVRVVGGRLPWLETAVGERWERWLVGLEGEGKVGERVWRLRWAGLLLVTLCVGFGGWVLALEEGADGLVNGGNRWLGWGYLMVPALAYLGGGASGLTPVVGGLVVGGAVLVALVHRDRVSPWVLGVGGFGLGVGFHGPVGGLPVLVMVVVMCLVAVALTPVIRTGDGPEERPVGHRVGWMGWGALLVGLSASRLLGTEAHDEAVRGWLVEGIRGLTDVGLPGFWVLAVGGIGCLWLVETLVMAWKRRRRRRTRHWQTGPVDALALAVMLGVGANLILPVNPTPVLSEVRPRLSAIEGQGPAAHRVGEPGSGVPQVRPAAYVWTVVVGFLGSWGPGDADMLVSRLFWQLSGIGEARLPDWIRWYATTWLAAGVALGLWRSGRTKNGVRLFRVGSLLLGLVAGVALAASLVVKTPGHAGIRVVMLLGAYLVLLPLGFLGWKGLILHWEDRRPRRIAILLVVPMVAMQAAALVPLLDRYLG